MGRDEVMVLVDPYLQSVAVREVNRQVVASAVARYDDLGAVLVYGLLQLHTAETRSA